MTRLRLAFRLREWQCISSGPKELGKKFVVFQLLVDEEVSLNELLERYTRCTNAPC